jgi:hypothetical protein
MMAQPVGERVVFVSKPGREQIRRRQFISLLEL